MTRNTRQATTAAVGAALIGVFAAGIVYLVLNRTPSMPTTAEEALALLQDEDALERIPDERRSQYMERAGELLRDLPWEERRALFEDEDNRDAMRRLFEEMLKKRFREYATGEQQQTEEQWGPPRRDRDDNNSDNDNQDQDNENSDEDNSDQENSDEENADQDNAERERPSRQERQQRIREHMNDVFTEGNPQTAAMMGESYKRRSENRGR